VDPAIPFADDYRHASYDPHATRLFWGQLLQASRVFGEFRSRFVGKVSLVHVFWGSPGLHPHLRAARAAASPSVPSLSDRVTREAYSAEMSSCGFLPGGGEEGAFYLSHGQRRPDGTGC
jgi:hypothetical protein